VTPASPYAHSYVRNLDISPQLTPHVSPSRSIARTPLVPDSAASSGMAFSAGGSSRSAVILRRHRSNSLEGSRRLRRKSDSASGSDDLPYSEFGSVVSSD
jgi:hypothetical protein